MSRPESATRVALPGLYAEAGAWAGRKVRTVGYLTAVDPASSLGVLAFERGAIVLDLSLCLEEGVYIPRLKTKLDCLGDLEPVDIDTALVANALLNDHVSAIPRPANPLPPQPSGPAPSSDREAEVDSSVSGVAAPHAATGAEGPLDREQADRSEIAPVVLRCLHFRCVDDLNIRAWNEATRMLQEHLPIKSK